MPDKYSNFWGTGFSVKWGSTFGKTTFFMANIVYLNVYQFNNLVYSPGAQPTVGFPTTGNILIWSCLNSPTRSLSSGVNVYSAIQISAPAAAYSNGNIYYVAETTTQLQSIFG
jgi:hypothetical protein